MVISGGILGAGLSRTLGFDRQSPDARLLSYSGAAGALSAFIGVPLAGSIFVHELSDPSAQIGSPGSLSPTILSSICAVFTKKVLLSWPSSPMGGHFSYGHEVANRTLIIKILSFQI